MNLGQMGPQSLQGTQKSLDLEAQILLLFLFFFFGLGVGLKTEGGVWYFTQMTCLARHPNTKFRLWGK